MVATAPWARPTVSHKKECSLVGVPKTIDNDISGTDYCIGFDTAVTEVARALDRLHSTAEAHNRVMIVEVLGRHEGWVAVLGRDGRRSGRYPGS